MEKSERDHQKRERMRRKEQQRRISCKMSLQANEISPRSIQTHITVEQRCILHRLLLEPQPSAVPIKFTQASESLALIETMALRAESSSFTTLTY